MITDEHLRGLATLIHRVTRDKVSTIVTCNQFAWDKTQTKQIPEKSLYIMYFGRKYKYTFDIIFRNHYFYLTDFRKSKIGGVATVTC